MDFSLFATYLLACGGAAATGAMFSPGAWYDSLSKPAWTPPNWLFPVAWTTLYLLMSAAAARLAPLPGSELAMAFWAVQIAFNTLWTPVFFGLRKLGGGLVVLAGLWLAVATLTVLAFRLDFWAGAMLLPYLAWVTVAGALNASVWRLNRAAA